MGGKRGRLIPKEMRELAIELIDEARDSGARIKKACEALDISKSTYERWRSGAILDSRKGAIKSVTRKFTEEEVKMIIDTCCSSEYKDLNPHKLHAVLLDKGQYIGSISSFYRILRQNKLLSHRGNTRPPQERTHPPERKATGPNQVWTWDITFLKTDVRGLFFYAYVIIDIWDRSIVRWAIHDREDDTLAYELFNQALGANNYPNVYVHSDNGNPMKGVTLMALFYDLGICNSYSRPRVSNDNPFIESLFKTLKYSSSYPHKFKTIAIAREWFALFVSWYNTSHSHSGINFVTPLEMRTGKYKAIVTNRNKVMVEAKAKNPHRWSQKVKKLATEHIVYLNPTADTRIFIKEKLKATG